MREVADRQRIEGLLRGLAGEATSETIEYLVGGTSAVLVGWRVTTIDVDLVIRPESDELPRAIPRLKAGAADSSAGMRATSRTCRPWSAAA